MKKFLSPFFIVFLSAILLSSFALAACSSTQPESIAPPEQQSEPVTQEQNAPAEQQQSAPAMLDGATLVQERCSTCHNLDRVNSAQKSADEWAATITRMIDKGAKLDQAELEAVIQFLAEAYP